MKGYIRQLTTKSYQLQVYTGIDKNGKPIRYFETVRGCKRDAQQRLRELLVGLDRGIPLPKGKVTVEEHLTRWLDGYVKIKCGPRTYDSHNSIIVKHLLPEFGRLQLKELTPELIQSYYGEACGKLSPRSVHYQHRILNQSLKYAVRKGYLGTNPCDLVDPPKWKRKTMRTLTLAEVEQLFTAAQDNYYYPVIYTAVSSGLRQAELLGLRWRDIDLDMLSISVNQVLYKRRGVCEFKEPKTQHSRRRVAMTSKLASYLKEYKADRESLYIQSGKVLKLDSLVFAHTDGTPLDPSVLSHEFARIVRRAKLGNVRFHDLRHTFASIMLMCGVNPKVVSEALGHASVAFTLDTYSHIINGVQENAMLLLDGVLPAAISKVNNAKLTQLLPENGVEIP